MPTNEEKIDAVLAEIATLKARLAKAEGTCQIQNLMGRFVFYQSVGDYRSIYEKLYDSEPSHSFEESTSGVMRDDGDKPDKIFRYFQRRYGISDNEEDAALLRGRLVLNALTSPVIEIEDDLCHARGIWITTGHETTVFHDGDAQHIPTVERCNPDADGKRHIAEWVWLKFGGEFVLERGAWKLHALHIYDILRTPYDKDWVSYSSERFEDDLAANAILNFGKYPFPPDGPTTYHWQYTSDAEPPLEPEII